MKMRDTLMEFVNYYNITRGIGHTTRVINGIDGSNAIVVVPTHRMGDHIRSKCKDKSDIQFVSISSMDRLRGTREPLVFDNAALQQLFVGAIDEMDRLTNEIASLKEKMKQAKKALE